MKKTLIALAAVAVSSAAMAQVTISGNVDARYQSLTTKVTALPGLYILANGTSGTGTLTADELKAGGVQVQTARSASEAAVSGFLISDAQLNFTATEDLGGGLKATARFTIDGATSDGGAITADGVFLSLAGGFGSVTFSNLDSSDYLANDLVTDQLGGTGSQYNGNVQDRITYTSPAISGIRFSATMQEGNIGAGKSATNDSMVYELDYAAGPLTANIGMLTADKKVHTTTDGLTRFRVGYNFGVAAVSYGQINAKDAAGVKDKITAVTVSVPLGAVSLSYAYATSKDGAAAKQDGTAISATYALSKRTSLTAQQVNYETSTFNSNKRTRLTMSHSF
jgi:predicted porin